MTTTDDLLRPEGTTERLSETLAQLTTDQIRFVISRCEHDTDQDAARALRIPPSRVKQWKYRGAPIDEAVRLMAFDGMATALELRRRHLAKAMAVKVAGLDIPDHKLRQDVATEIIEWEMGKAQQSVDVTSKGEKLDGGGLTDDRRVDALMALYERVRARLLSQSVDGEPPVDAAAGAAG